MKNVRTNEETTMNRRPVGAERVIPNGGTHMRREFSRTWVRVCFVITLLFAVQAYADDVKKEPPLLTNARGDYECELKAVTKPIATKYIQRLENMKRDLGGKGDAVGAIAVQQEIDTVTASLSEKPKSPSEGPASSIAGTWRAQFGDRVMEYEFQKHGIVRTKAPSSGTWQYKKVKGGILIDFQGLKLELWEPSEDPTVWNIRHYAPAATYPKGEPAVTGVATKQ